MYRVGPPSSRVCQTNLAASRNLPALQRPARPIAASGLEAIRRCALPRMEGLTKAAAPCGGLHGSMRRVACVIIACNAQFAGQPISAPFCMPNGSAKAFALPRQCVRLQWRIRLQWMCASPRIVAFGLLPCRPATSRRRITDVRQAASASSETECGNGLAA